jgi:uncharacterized OB-fold protein
MYGDGSRADLTADGKPLPVVTPLNQPFWACALGGVFALQTCKACGHKHVPESPVCPQCLSPDQEWRPASGEGVLESWVDFHRAYWDGFAAELPYRVCLVRLKEGPLFVSNLVGAPAETKYGAAVRVVFKRVSDQIALPLFALVADGPGASTLTGERHAF